MRALYFSAILVTTTLLPLSGKAQVVNCFDAPSSGQALLECMSSNRVEETIRLREQERIYLTLAENKQIIQTAFTILDAISTMVNNQDCEVKKHLDALIEVESRQAVTDADKRIIQQISRDAKEKYKSSCGG